MVSDESIGGDRSTGETATMTRNPNYTYIAVWACGSTARLESECEARLRGLAHVPRMVDDGPVLGYVKYLMLTTSL